MTGDQLVTDITAEAGEFARQRGDGLLHLFLPHATCGFAIMETGSGSEADLTAAIDRLWPREVAYEHAHGTAGHGRDHVLPAFIAPSLSVPVLGGVLQLGTWQRICLVDTNVDNCTRVVRLSFLAG